MRWMTVVPLVLLALPLCAQAQNNGLPNRQQSVVLLELFVDRGPACGLLSSWQAEALRVQTRGEAERLDQVGREAVARAVEARRSEMTCEDPLLVTWTEAAAPNLEREFLPELLTAYLALALQADPPTAFLEATADHRGHEPIERIERRIAEFEAAGVAPPGGLSWTELRARQSESAAEIAAAAAGSEPRGRDSTEEAEQTLRDIASIVGLWLVEG